METKKILKSLNKFLFSKTHKKTKMKKGYLAMGKINSELAEQGIYADDEQFLTYEQKLSESECIDY